MSPFAAWPSVGAVALREDIWDSYAFSLDLKSPRRLLGMLLREAFSTDLTALSSTDPDRAALLAVARFEYEVKKGGFAQLLFNLRNTGLETLGQALVYAGGSVAAQLYARALAVCRQMPADYARFLASDFQAPNPLKDALHGVSLDYFPLVPIEAEVAPLLARFVLLDTTVFAVRALPPAELGHVLKDEIKDGPVRPLLLDAIARFLRATGPVFNNDFFACLGYIAPPQILRLHEQIAAGGPDQAILLAIPLCLGSAEDPALAASVARAVALGPRSAIEVLGFVRAAVLSGGDFGLRKPVGLWPDMPLFGVVQGALASPDAEVRAAAAAVPGPWSWSSDQRAAAIADAADDEEARILASFVSAPSGRPEST